MIPTRLQLIRREHIFATVAFSKGCTCTILTHYLGLYASLFGALGEREATFLAALLHPLYCGAPGQNPPKSGGAQGLEHRWQQLAVLCWVTAWATGGSEVHAGA